MTQGNITRAVAPAIFMLAAMIFAVSAQCDGTVLMQFKSRPGESYIYGISTQAQFDADIDAFPIPQSAIKLSSLKASIDIDSYFDTIDTGEDGHLSMTVHNIVRQFVLGDTLRHGDLTALGINSLPNIHFDIQPDGRLKNMQFTDAVVSANLSKVLKMVLPGDLFGSTGVDPTSLDTLLPLLVSVTPAILPQGPVAPGATWDHSSQAEAYGSFLPRITTKYELISIENGIAHIKYSTTGKYDMAFLNALIANYHDVPAGTDYLDIARADVIFDWRYDGIIDFDIPGGFARKITWTGTFSGNASGIVDVKHEDNTKQSWAPALDMNLSFDGAAEFRGFATRNEMNLLFPPK